MSFCTKKICENKSVLKYQWLQELSIHSLLVSGILLFGVCLHWFSKQRHHSHPFVQQQLQSRDPSSNLLDGPCFCFAKLKRLIRLVEKKILAFSVCECSWNSRCANVRYVEASIEIYCFIPARHHIRYSFRFLALSVEKHLSVRIRMQCTYFSFLFLINLQSCRKSVFCFVIMVYEI